MPFIGKLAKLPGVGEAVVALAAKSGSLADAAKHAYADLTNEANAQHMKRMNEYVQHQLLINPVRRVYAHHDVLYHERDTALGPADKLFLGLLLQGYSKAMLSTVRNFPLATLEPLFSRLGAESKMPVRLLWGDKDVVVPYANHVRMLQLVPHAEFLGIQGCGHTDTFAKFKAIFREVLLSFFGVQPSGESPAANST